MRHATCLGHRLRSSAVRRGLHPGKAPRDIAWKRDSVRSTGKSVQVFQVVLDVSKQFVLTPDGRYFLVRGRLWRATNPHLSAAERNRLVGELMRARRAVRASADDPTSLRAARNAVDSAKQRLGERGPVWWTDDSPDYNRRMVINTPYSDWYRQLRDRGAADITRRQHY